MLTSFLHYLALLLQNAGRLKVCCLDHDKQDSVLPLVDALSIIKPGCLHYLCLQELSLRMTEDDVLAILEVIFCSLVPTADPYFELDISRLDYTKGFGRSIYDSSGRNAWLYHNWVSNH